MTAGRLPSAAVAALLASGVAAAGVYPAAEKVPFPVSAAGVAAELAYEPQFKSLLDDRVTALNPASPREAGGKPTPRGAALARLAAAPPAPSVAEQADLAALAIRVGTPDAAVNRLAGRLRDRSPDYVALVTLAHAHAVRAEWPEARRAHEAAVLDADPPAALPGATADQTKWLLQVERTHYARWLRLPVAAPGRRDVSGEGPLDLFPGVRFVGESGRYEAGVMAAAERAKLPADAVAVVQLLALWAPDDVRLLWLLGELYNADGRVRDAAKVFEQCTDGRKFTSRPALMAHRQAVKAAADALPPESAVDDLPDAPPAPPADPAAGWAELRPTVVAVAAGVAVVAALMLALQVRAWRNRGRR